MAEEISKPLCKAKKVTMVSSGGGDVGAAKLSGEVLDIMTRLPDAVEKLTGVNISQVSPSVNEGLHSVDCVESAFTLESSCFSLFFLFFQTSFDM